MKNLKHKTKQWKSHNRPNQRFQILQMIRLIVEYKEIKTGTQNWTLNSDSRLNQNGGNKKTDTHRHTLFFLLNLCYFFHLMVTLNRGQFESIFSVANKFQSSIKLLGSEPRSFHDLGQLPIWSCVMVFEGKLNAKVIYGKYFFGIKI